LPGCNRQPLSCHLCLDDGSAGLGVCARTLFVCCAIGEPVTTIYLIRHAQSQPSPDVPEPDWPLSAVGVGQARGLVGVLQPLGIQRIYSSPFRRCRDTLAPFAHAAGLEVALHDGLRERLISPTWMSDFRDIWWRSWADLDFALPGGESSTACRARVAAAVEEIVVRHPGETLALGSHGNAIALFLHYVDATVGMREAGAVRTPEILKIVRRGGQFTWERTFSAGEEFDRLATDFRKTPGVVA
jgi:2,3-bisphosphoglycerate-dependent phosphoglycerate mutase